MQPLLRHEGARRLARALRDINNNQPPMSGVFLTRRGKITEADWRRVTVAALAEGIDPNAPKQ